MISFEEALYIILSQDVTPTGERMHFASSPGRILLEDIISDMDMPPFDKSAVDGFACRMADIPSSLRVLETIAAGRVPVHTVATGQCSRIMTGAMVPAGADCVVMVEDTEQVKEDLVKILKPVSSKNICYRGEDVHQGDVVLRRGTRLTPAHVAVLASVGAVNPLVARMPRAGIIATGDELVEPGVIPGPARIRNSNGWQIEAQLRSVPALPVNCGIVADEVPLLAETIRKTMNNTDILLLTGGVSMGDFDFVPAILQEAGVEILFKSIAIQPGRPTVFGRKGGTFVFGLPGNPVSSFVIFETLVRPFLYHMMGHDFRPVSLVLPMGADFSRRNPARKSMVPVIVRNGEVCPLEYHGSAHINAYTQADGILEINQGVALIRKGEPAHVRLL